MNGQQTLRYIGGCMMLAAFGLTGVVVLHEFLGWGWNAVAIYLLILGGMALVAHTTDVEDGAPGADDVDEWEAE